MRLQQRLDTTPTRIASPDNVCLKNILSSRLSVADVGNSNPFRRDNFSGALIGEETTVEKDDDGGLQIWWH